MSETQTAAVKKTIAEWGEAKGLLPRFMILEDTNPNLQKRRAPRRINNPNFWKFEAARVGKQWLDNHEVTEAEFDDAVLKYSGHPDHKERVTFGIREIGETADDPAAIKRIAKQRQEREERDAKVKAEAEAKAEQTKPEEPAEPVAAEATTPDANA